jgi:hypothetical protein
MKLYSETGVHTQEAYDLTASIRPDLKAALDKIRAVTKNQVEIYYTILGEVEMLLCESRLEDQVNDLKSKK